MDRRHDARDFREELSSVERESCTYTSKQGDVGMELTPDQKTQYEAEGYTWVRGLISPEELAPVRARLMELLDGEHDWPDTHFQVLDPGAYKNKKGGPVPIGVQRPSKQEEVFRNIADHGNLQAAMAQLLGGPAKRFTDQALIKNKVIDGQSFYHQDSYYWKIKPQLGCNSWIAMDTVGANASALSILPRTHKSWELVEHERYYDEPNFFNQRTGEPFMRWRIPEETVDRSQEVQLPMEPGDAAFFTNYTWHRADPNESGEHIVAYAIAYQLANGSGE